MWRRERITMRRVIRLRILRSERDGWVCVGLGGRGVGVGEGMVESLELTDLLNVLNVLGGVGS